MSLIDVAKKLAAKCSIEHPPETSEISAYFISNLYMRICQPYLEDPPVLPVLSLQPREHLSTILESLSCNFLNLDLDPLLQVEDILAGDERAVSLLLRIFDNLYDVLECSSDASNNCASTSKQEKKVQKMKPMQPSLFRPSGPTYKGDRVAHTRSASVLYSPRTAAIRRLKGQRNLRASSTAPALEKSVMVSRPKAATVPKMSPAAGKPLSDKRAPSDHERIRHQQQEQRSDLLHWRTKHADRRQARISVERAKASIRNAVAEKRHLLALSKKTIDDLLRSSVSSEIELESAKEKAKKTFSNTKDTGTPKLLPEPAERNENADGISIEFSRERARERHEIRCLLSDLSTASFC